MSFSTAHTICIFCSAPHDSFKCKMSPQNKLEILKNTKRCFKCFRMYHISKNCYSNKLSCFKCKSGSHHSSICLGNNRNNNSAKINQTNKPEDKCKESLNLNCNAENIQMSNNSNSEIVSSVSQCNASMTCSKNVYLQTCTVVAKSEFNSKIARILLDNGSQKSFVNENLANILKLKPIRYELLSVYSFGMQQATQKKYPVVEFEIKARNNAHTFKIETLVIPCISGAIISPPNKQISEFMTNRHLELADSCYGNKYLDVQILIGSDYIWEFILDEKIAISKHIGAIKTVFGWVITGSEFRKEEACSQNIAVMKNAVINNDIRTFWELDSIGILTESEELSMKDKQIIDQFENSLSFNNGRYQTKLLWKSNPDELNNNFQIAKRRFEILKAKLDKDIEVREEYTKIVEEQLQNGIVEVYENKDLESGYYMPHRAVIRPDKETSRVRFVFDASSKGENSKSLNDLLEAGPNLNPNILDVILKFREHNITFSADIEKAFLMISIAEEDLRKEINYNVSWKNIKEIAKDCNLK
ncbi:hypothetical protein X975_04158, partial [Stegodyphus mimosarum]